MIPSATSNTCDNSLVFTNDTEYHEYLDAVIAQGEPG